MRHIFFVLMLFVAIIFMLIDSNVIAQDEPLYGCTINERRIGYWQYATDGEDTLVVSSQVRAIYDEIENHFILMDRETRQIVQILEDELDTPEFTLMGWTPDCHYVLANLLIDGQRILVAWDTVSGERVHTWARFGSYGSKIHWHPTEDYVVVEADYGGYLWYLPTNNQILINARTEYYGSSFHRVDWDTVRQQLLVVEMGLGNTVRAYDLRSGNRIGEFYTVTFAAPVNFALSPDGSLISVFTSEEERAHDDRPSGVSVWNRDSGTPYHLQLASNTLAATLRSQVAFSPDNRYFVIARDDIRVWDLQQLPEEVNMRQPIFIHDGPEGRVGIVRFTDNTTFETRNVYNTGSASLWLSWDVITGDFLEEHYYYPSYTYAP